MIHTLQQFTVELNLDALRDRLHVADDSPDVGALQELADRARAVACPKAVFMEAFVGSRGEETVEIDGISFTSRVLRNHLSNIDRVFPFVITCGRELDDVALPADDILASYWWDVIKGTVLTEAFAQFTAMLKKRYRLSQAASMMPGSGDLRVWPIEQQKLLFALLDQAPSKIGVELTDECLMIPDKTSSGIHFPTTRDFRGCQVCRRVNCPSRRAPTDHEMLEQMHL